MKSQAASRAAYDGILMTIAVRQSGSVTIFDLEGPLKMGEAEESFTSRIEELLGGGTKALAVNLAGVPEVDSSGIGALIRAHSAARQAGGHCKFFSAPQRVMRTLKMVRLDGILDLVKDEAAALAAF
ncbi:MAG: STAS domain-containing protein [Terriglobia bacterium]